MCLSAIDLLLWMVGHSYSFDWFVCWLVVVLLNEHLGPWEGLGETFAQRWLLWSSQRTLPESKYLRCIHAKRISMFSWASATLLWSLSSSRRCTEIRALSVTAKDGITHFVVPREVSGVGCTSASISPVLSLLWTTTSGESLLLLHCWQAAAIRGGEYRIPVKMSGKIY